MIASTNNNIDLSATKYTRDSASNSIISRAKFRNEVLEQRSNQWLGKTTLALPLSFATYSLSALGLTTLIIAFLIFGSYSQTESVAGVITPQNGIVKVSATLGGVVADVYVHEGERVVRGTPLFRIRELPQATETAASTEVKSTSATEIFHVIEAPVSGRIYSLPAHKMDEIKSYQPEPIATIASADALVVEAAVSAAVQARTKAGMHVQLEINAFKGRPQSRLTGVVIAVAAAPTEEFDLMSGGNKRSYKVVLRINSTDHNLPPDELLGKMVSVRFVLEKRKLYQWLVDPMQNLFRS